MCVCVLIQIQTGKLEQIVLLDSNVLFIDPSCILMASDQFNSVYIIWLFCLLTRIFNAWFQFTLSLIHSFDVLCVFITNIFIPLTASSKFPRTQHKKLLLFCHVAITIKWWDIIFYRRVNDVWYLAIIICFIINCVSEPFHVFIIIFIFFIVCWSCFFFSAGKVWHRLYFLWW